MHRRAWAFRWGEATDEPKFTVPIHAKNEWRLPMHPFLTKALDRLAFASAQHSVPSRDCKRSLQEIRQLLDSPDFFPQAPPAVPELQFRQAQRFEFISPISTHWPENNRVPGRFYRSGADWTERPTVLLLHGWNGELGYWLQFPPLAWRLNKAGVNCAMIELPFHATRKPKGPGRYRNFLSPDLLETIESVRQSVADIRAMLSWLEAQGCRTTGLLGISLGAWLAGLVLCRDPRVDFGVLITPVARMERVIMDLPFCEPIRRNIPEVPSGAEFSILNLAALKPFPPPEKILLIASQYDLFAPFENLEELWAAWNRPEIWRVPHGHISVLLSLPVWEKAVRWMQRQGSPRATPV